MRRSTGISLAIYIEIMRFFSMWNLFLWISESNLHFCIRTCFVGSVMYYKFNTAALRSLLANTFRSLKYYFSKHWTSQFHGWQVHVSSSKVLQNPDAEKICLKLCIRSVLAIYRHSSNAFEIKKWKQSCEGHKSKHYWRWLISFQGTFLLRMWHISIFAMH